MSIKDLAPNRNSKFNQGTFDLTHCTNYIGAPPVIYRSSLELQSFNMCANSATVVGWESEPDIAIYYMFGGKKRRYNIDLLVKQLRPDSSIITWLVEVKPMWQVVGGSKSRHQQTVHQQNTEKWKAANAYCQQHGMKFMIMTEKFFEKMLTL